MATIDNEKAKVLEQSVVDELVSRICNAVQPNRIILFGSAATGEMTPDSDIDLLVLNPAPVEQKEEVKRIRESLRSLGLAIDVFVLSTERFEETKDIVGGISHPAHKYGKVIYESD